MSGGWKKTFDLFVGNLSQNIIESDVVEVFSSFDGFDSVLLKEGNRGDGSKIAFVKFLTEEAADEAVAAAANISIKDCTPTLRRSKPKQEKDGYKDKQRKGFKSKMQQNEGGFSSFKPDGHTDQGEGPASYTPQKQQQQQQQVNHVKPVKPMQSMEPIRKEELMMTHVDGPCMFWAQVLDAGKMSELQAISESLNVVCPRAPIVTGQPELQSKVYACKFSEDGLWYRCKVLRFIDSNKSQVQYIDYGNGEVVENSAIHELPGNLSSPRGLAMRYVLYGLTPLFMDANSVGFEQGVIKLRQLTENQSLHTDVFPGSKGVIPVIINTDKDDINQEMLTAGFAERRMGLVKKPFKQGGSRNNQQWQQQQVDPAMLPQLLPNQFTQPPPPLMTNGQQPWGSPQPPQPPPHTHTPPLMPVSNMESTFLTMPPPSHGGQGDAGFGAAVKEARRMEDAMGGSIGTWEDHVASPPPPGVATSTNPPPFPPPPAATPPHSGGGGGVGGLDHQVQSQLGQQLEAIAHFQHQIDHIQRQYTAIEGRAQSLERERNESLVTNAKLKGNIMELQKERDEKHKGCLALLQKMEGMNNRVREVEEYVKRVRELRRQFPTDGNVRDNIDYALALLVDNPNTVSLDKVEGISVVKQAEQRYNQAQEVIAKTPKADLEDAIHARDDARRHLHDSIVVFLQEAESLPLERRCADLRAALSALRQSHGAFLQPEMKATIPLQDVMAMYKPWKDKKDVEFQDVRTETNTCHNEINTALGQTQQVLSLELSLSDAAPSMCGSVSLDTILLKFMYRLQQEMKVTDLEKSADATFVTMQLKSIIHAMAKEMGDIDQLVSLQKAYREKKSELAEWLEKKPDTEPLKQIRQNIKALKSKLRHKLADKQDAEECEESEVSLDEIKNEISGIRQLLQAEFIQEDKLLVELCEQSMKHFPELVVQFPDTGLDLVAEHGDLVKKGRSLDHYDIKPAKDNNSVRFTTFNEEAVVLKEYIIDENLGTPKQQFMERLLAYHKVVSEHIIPVEAVFFLQNQRHAHVQVPNYGLSLAQRLQDNKEEFTPKCVCDILLGVLKGLDALHQNNIVHGAVNPNNVFIKPDGMGILAEFDFTKSLRQRNEKPYVSAQNLKFSSPETNIHDVISKASDIFNLGLLALWLMFPSVSFPLETSGVPQAPLNPDQFPADLQALLNVAPEKRPSAQQLLFMPYFSPHDDIPEPQEDTDMPEPAQEEQEPVTLQLRSKSPTSAVSPKDRTSPDTVRKGILKTSPPQLQSFVPIPSTATSQPEHNEEEEEEEEMPADELADMLKEDVMAEVNAKIDAHLQAKAEEEEAARAAAQGETAGTQGDAELEQLDENLSQQLVIRDSEDSKEEEEEEEAGEKEETEEQDKSKKEEEDKSEKEEQDKSDASKEKQGDDDEDDDEEEEESEEEEEEEAEGVLDPLDEDSDDIPGLDPIED